jgi:osmoprotectant transport system permease protein
LFELLEPIPGLGLSRTTAEVALVSYTLLIMFRNTLTGLREVPAEVRDAARGMGMGPMQSLLRVELPLALPAITAGVRIATVTVISLATVAASVAPLGLGKPIFDAIQSGFTTELVAPSLLLIVLALVADTLLVLVQRAITPWARAARS